jgi:subtilisin family serine protease
MAPKWIFRAALLALAAGPIYAVHSAGTDARATYVVTLRAAPLVDDAVRRVRAQAAMAGGHGEMQAMRQALKAPESIAYLRQLDSSRNALLDLAGQHLGRKLAPTQIYRHVLNGVALQLTQPDADRLAQLPGVESVQRERISHTHTDAGPQWIGADQLWSGQVAGVAATKGEGVVVGVIDTGINPSHPSFASTGGDGYAHTNPRGKVYGLCATGQASCTDKLIGMYDFTDEGTKGVDSTGHGSHVSGIVAGNVYSTTLHGQTVDLPRTVSGVAPHANLIMYKACKVDSSGGGGSCPGSSLLSAIDQAVSDQVDVINFSIGGDASDPWSELQNKNSDTAAMFRARAAGIVVAVSAGNDGPSPHTVAEPANAPWVIGVASASHNRRFANRLVNLNGVANAPADIAGVGFTAGYGPAKIVYAGDFGFPLCGTGATEATPDGASNPWPAGTFHGEIVICDRGTYGRVEKGYNLKAAGAGGYVLANAASNGESVVSDSHWLPAVHIGYGAGTVLKAWVAQSGTHNGTISGVSAVLDASYGDIIDSFSSRGPEGFTGGLLKPDITAPGSNILSAAQTGNGLALLSGTSMASPHVAGALALVRAVHRDWNPAQVESALLGTALANSLRKEDAATPATPLDGGSGRVQPASAVQAGLYLPLSTNDIVLTAPASGGSPRNLNRIGMEDEHCFQNCSFTRTVADMSDGGSWQVSVSAPSGANITVTPNQFSLAAGASQQLSIAAEVSDPHLVGTWVAARVLLHKTGGGRAAADIALQMDVYSDPGTQPAFRDISANGPGGHIDIPLSGLAALPQATYAVTVPALAQVSDLNLPVDPNPSKLYDTFPGTGKQFVLIPIKQAGVGACPAQPGRVLIAEITGSTAQQPMLTAGIDSDGDGQPSAAEERCGSSADNNGTARCVVDLRNAPVSASNVWVLVDVPNGVAGTNYDITLSAAVSYLPGTGSCAPSANPYLTTGPGHADARQTLPVRLAWSNLYTGSSTRYYGAILVDGAAGLSGQTAMLPFALARSGSNDVADAMFPYVGSGDPPPEGNGTYNYAFSAAEQLQHRFIDLPPGATSLHVQSDLTAAGNADIQFSAVRADFPAAASSPAISAAPAGSPAESWTLNASTASKAVDIPATPGRWYINAAYAGSQPAAASVKSSVTMGGGNNIAPGAYYNTQRSGQGFFMSQILGVQAVNWYTYLDDGTPVWYSAQGSVPQTAGAIWHAPLYRVNWDGAKVNTRAVVGDLILTPVSDNDLMFSWHLDGQAGSEHFTRLGAGTCPNLNGTPTNFNGAWYAPSQSGYGMDVIALPTLQAGAFYFYDALGVSRWGFLSTSPFALSSAIGVTQYQGFCPQCDYIKATTQALGTLNVSYNDAASGNFSTAFNLQAPLNGIWNVNQSIVRLTGTATCPQ